MKERPFCNEYASDNKASIVLQFHFLISENNIFIHARYIIIAQNFLLQ